MPELLLQVKRKAKYILIYLEDNLVIVIHLGMSGRLTVSDKQYLHTKYFKPEINL